MLTTFKLFLITNEATSGGFDYEVFGIKWDIHYKREFNTLLYIVITISPESRECDPPIPLSCLWGLMKLTDYKHWDGVSVIKFIIEHTHCDQRNIE